MKKKILIAEDDPSLQEIYQLLLSRKGYKVEMMFNANLMGDWSGEKADLFLLDLHLSGNSGLEICRRLKGQPATRQIPVIMISSDPDLYQLAKSSGADESIQKPFNSRRLLEAISAQLGKIHE